MISIFTTIFVLFYIIHNPQLKHIQSKTSVSELRPSKEMLSLFSLNLLNNPSSIYYK